MSTELEQLEKNIQPKTTNYIKFQPGEKKVLLFKYDKDSIQEVEPYQDQTKTRIQFTVQNLEGPKLATPEDEPGSVPQYYLWTTAHRWARTVISYLKRDQLALMVERQGSGTQTNYIIVPALD